LRRALVIFVVLVTASCVSFQYQREIVECEPRAAVVEGLLAGTTELEGVLAYGGLRSREWNVEVSVPIADSGSASLSYSDTTAKTRGTIFVFDAELHLQIVRSGLLGDLRQTFARRRPASIDDGDDGAKRP